MMLYKNAKVIVRSTDDDTNSFVIESGVLRGDTSTLCVSKICLDNVLQTSTELKKNGFTLKNKKQVADDILQKPEQIQTTQMT